MSPMSRNELKVVNAELSEKYSNYKGLQTWGSIAAGSAFFAVLSLRQRKKKMRIDFS